MTVEKLLAEHDLVLTGAAVVERLRRSQVAAPLHPLLVHAPLIYDDAGREALGDIYHEYLDIAERAGFPSMAGAPTWRANLERVEQSGLARDFNEDSIRFLDQLRAGRAGRKLPILIGGVVGCRGDCYTPSEGLPADEAEAFHSWQIERLVLAGADYVSAVTLPALPEAIGVARAITATETPAIVSFVIGRDGCLLDGTPVAEAIDAVDQGCSTAPAGYMVNCAYPSFLDAALKRGGDLSRLIGIEGNASSRDHGDLEGAPDLWADDLDDWIDRMVALHRDAGFKLLGGCCGTDGSYLEGMVRSIRSSP